MSLPEGFNEFEFLQDLMRKWQNKAVREEFIDMGGEDWDPDITISRGAMRHACTHKDTDTAEMLLMRNDLFYLYLRKARDFHPPVYGQPKATFDEDTEYHPQVFLFFAQDEAAVPENRCAIQAEHRITLVNETERSINDSKAEILARAIRREFASSRPTFSWNKGKRKAYYLDKTKGYDFRVQCFTEEEGERVIRKLLDIQGDPFDEDLFRDLNPRKNSINNPTGTTLVYGRQRPKKRWRPNGLVRFRWASLHINNLGRIVTLVDTTGSFPEALERA
jgi:hypothetical protein